jgi:NADH-quinone oxidoreductase subunit G
MPVSWEEALEAVSDKIRAYSFNFTVLAGGRLSNEDLYSLKDLADTVHGRSLLYSTMAGGDLVAKLGPGSQANLGLLGAGSVIVVAACDLHEEAPVWWLRVRNAIKRGAKLVVANARDTRLDQDAHFTIRYPFGKEAEAVLSLLPDAPDADELNQLIAGAEELVVFYGSDGTGYESSIRLAAACAQLIQHTGHTGKSNSGLIPVWQHANDQGAWDIGFRPEPNLDSTLEHDGVIYIAGADPAGDCPDCQKAMKKSNFLVVQELFLTETAKLADVVFPAQAFTEREGSMTSGERRVQRYYPVIDPPEGTLPDFAIAARVKQKIGRMNLDINAASQVFLALSAHTPDYDGLTYQKLSQSVDQWPIIGRQDLYYGGTSYENSQGLGVKLSSAAERGQKLDLPDVGPYKPLLGEDALVGYPVTLCYDRGTTITPSELLAQRLPGPYITLHPDMLRQLNLTAGDRVVIQMKGKAYPVDLRSDDSIPVNSALTPRSLGLPALEPVPVSVMKAQKG